MKPLTVESLTPDLAEIRDLRRSVFLLGQDLVAALHSRAIWHARFRRAEVEIGREKALIEIESGLLSQALQEIEKRKEDEQALAQRVEELEAENEELLARLVPSPPKKARKR